MRRFTALVLTAAIPLALLASLTLRQRPSLAQVSAPARSPVAAVPHRTMLGAMSCSASVCHGGGVIGQPLSESATWRALDPHARAWETLRSLTSSAIAQRLWGDAARAHEAPLCLKCHVDPDYDRARPNFRRADGVGCESCHGAAQDWLVPHYRADWRHADQRATGFADTKSLPGRAAICARCHVGMLEANVDHDLIAAGHPPLRFEFATYLANIPPHWDVAKDKRANSTDPKKSIDFELRAWTIGQIVTSATALDLLAHRADPKAGKTWPEFAEMDCLACHHDLHGASWRQNRKLLEERRPGSPSWSDWHVVMLNPALLVRSGENAPKIFMDFRAKSKERADLSKQAHAAALSLRELATEPASNDPLLLRGWIKRTPAKSWDGAAQRYFALMALRALRKDNHEPVDLELEKQIATLRAASRAP